MPPVQGQKRPRLEEEVEMEPKVEEPKIIKEKSWITISKYGNLTTSICKKKEAIRKLNQHITAETIPKSLEWNPKVFVSTPYQGDMTDTVRNAAISAQKMIIEKLIQIRGEELDQLEEARSELLQDWENETRLTLTQLQTEGIWSGDLNTVITNVKKELSTKLDEKRTKVELIEFTRRKKKEDSIQKAQEKKQQRAIDKTLTSPEINDLQQKYEKLVKEVETLKGKVSPKPVPEKEASTGGGKKASNKPKSQKEKKSKQPNPNPGKGQGNRKPHSRSKPSTNQSESRQKNSRPKRG